MDVVENVENVQNRSYVKLVNVCLFSRENHERPLLLGEPLLWKTSKILGDKETIDELK
jgi:hypothetical protein|tara:strand:+ start:485 stop:658 length:174 start_codon:yes stop_codon:yes gene_type:complete